ncbi:MAG: DUF1573 domain-containing protein [Paludibacteraceae bacterium]|nr:DUF1573 domain-containing protein [Paludibacteraceae bacterium]MBQ9672597.1 DUF1573 domain-containing protein [Prevotella sp.]
MKNRTLLTLLLLAATLSTSAQQLVADQLSFDCGKTAYQVPVTATFTLQNMGAKRLHISDVKADCGCTKVSLSKKELGAGDKCTVKLTYDANMLGHFVKQASVAYHTKQGAQTVGEPLLLQMKGVVVAELKDYSGTYPYALGDLLADKNVLEFDDVNKGDHPEQEIHILNNGTTTMTPNIEHLPPYLTAIVTPEQLQPGRSGKVVVTLTSQKLPDYGLNQTTVYLASQLGAKISPDNELPVSVVLLPDLKTFQGRNKQYAPKMVLSDTKIDLGLIQGKQRKKGEIIITNKGRLPLEISSIQMFTGGLKLTLDQKELQPQEQSRLKVTGDLDVLRKSRTKPRILMITNDPDHSKVVIPINIK